MAMAFTMLLLLVVVIANVAFIDAFRVQSLCRLPALAPSRCPLRQPQGAASSLRLTALRVAPRDEHDENDGDRPSRLMSSVGGALQRMRRYAAGLMTVIIVTFSMGVHSASARAPRRGGGRVRETVPAVQVAVASETEESTAAAAAAAAGGDVAVDAAPARKVRLELSIEDGAAARTKRLTQLGYAVTGAATVLALLQGDGGGGKSKQKRRAVKPAPRRPAPDAEDGSNGDDDIFTPRARIAPPVPPARLVKGSRGLGSLPPPEELFGEKDSDDDLFGTSTEAEDEDDGAAAAPPAREAPRSVAASMAGKLPRARTSRPPAADDDVDNDDYDDAPATLAPSPAPAPVPAPAPSPAPAPAKKNIFDRIFQKNTSSRPTDLAEVMRIEDASAEFRAVRLRGFLLPQRALPPPCSYRGPMLVLFPLQATATILAEAVPPSVDLFDDVRAGGLHAFDGDAPADPAAQAALLVEVRERAALETRDVAEAFADVANAMIVSLSDRAVDVLDNRAKLPPQEAEAASVAAVTALADFALSAAGLFGQVRVWPAWKWMS